MKEYLKKHIYNFRGTNTPKLLVIEYDNWDSICIPNKQAQQKLVEQNLINSKCTFSKYDTLESAEDYSVLYKVLYKDKNIDGNSPIITANFIMSNLILKNYKYGVIRSL